MSKSWGEGKVWLHPQAGHRAHVPKDGSDSCFSSRKVLAHEAETAGAIMAFFLSLGLALGAAVSFLIRILI